MSERAAPPLGRPRVNPFAFPSETTLRFILLVIFVVCGSAGCTGNSAAMKIRRPTNA